MANKDQSVPVQGQQQPAPQPAARPAGTPPPRPVATFTDWAAI